MSSQKRSRANFENEGTPSHAPYAYYGTPLPAFDQDVRDDGSYVPVWKQEVTDDRGRKRLHGASTGGWSAGYFNSVGSKDGWTPSTFVSSRTSRAKQNQQQRAEDFMDDEDLAEQAESQKIETQGAFAGLGATEPNIIGRGMFSDLFRTTGETMGVKLLQRMGWREGQGIGPKVERRAQGDTTGDDHAFAPDDSRMISLVRKNDRKGLGFAGEVSLASRGAFTNDADEEGEVDARIFSRKSKIAKIPKRSVKSGFGVGVLNDTGSDDEDAYSIGPHISYNHTIGGKAEKQKKTEVVRGNTTARAITKASKLTQRSANSLAGLRKCHDGKLPLQGFVLSTKPILILQENQYPPPNVPPGWKPSRLSTTIESVPYQSTAEAAKTSSLDATSRAALLGEQQLKGKSVFDFLKPHARDKLAAASGKDNLPQAGGEGRPEGFSDSDKRTLWDVVPQIEKDTAIAALQRGSRGWMPYAEDQDKRTRYKAFISLQAGLSTSLPERPHGFSTDEWVKEMREFAQAAEVFKPISGLMATRFTTSSSSPQLASDKPELPAVPERTKDPAEEAAQSGMYGALTRSRLPFRPTRLLCKRFNVKPPSNVEVDPGDSEPGVTTTDLVSKATIDRMMSHASFTPSTSKQALARVDAGANEALERSMADESTLRSVFED